MTQRGRGGWQTTRGAHTGEMVSEIHVVEQRERSEELHRKGGVGGKRPGEPILGDGK